VTGIVDIFHVKHYFEGLNFSLMTNWSKPSWNTLLYSNVFQLERLLQQRHQESMDWVFNGTSTQKGQCAKCGSGGWGWPTRYNAYRPNTTVHSKHSSYTNVTTEIRIVWLSCILSRQRLGKYQARHTPIQNNLCRRGSSLASCIWHWQTKAMTKLLRQGPRLTSLIRTRIRSSRTLIRRL